VYVLHFAKKLELRKASMVQAGVKNSEKYNIMRHENVFSLQPGNGKEKPQKRCQTTG
jgi:hypothetical protein